MSCQEKQIQEIISFVEQGWCQLRACFSKKHKTNVILVAGITGTGKTTVANIVTGDLSKIRSVKSEFDDGNYIETQNRDISSGSVGQKISSDTEIPDFLICNNNPDLTFVDCPGFNDNRGTAKEISTMMNLKVMVEQLELVKFVFVVPWSAISYANIDKNAFLALCSNVVTLIKDINKFANSMCLVITRVTNFNPANGEKLTDDNAKKIATKFLIEVSSHNSISPENRAFVNCLLTNAPDWVLLRFPVQTGPLINMNHFVQVRNDIQDICQVRMEAAPVTADDFSLSLSSDSKCYVQAHIIPSMKQRKQEIVDDCWNQLKVDYINSIDLELEQNNMNSWLKAAENLQEICRILKLMEEEESNFNGSVIKFLTSVSANLNLALRKHKVNDLEKNEELLRFFIEMAGSMEDPFGLCQFFISFSKFKTALERKHENVVELVNEQCRCKKNAYDTEQKAIAETFGSKYKLNFDSIIQEQDYGCSALVKLGKDRKVLDELQELSLSCKLSELIYATCTGTETELREQELCKIKKHENDLSSLHEYINGSTPPYSTHNQTWLFDVSKIFDETRRDIHGQLAKNQLIQLQSSIQKMVSFLLKEWFRSFKEETLYINLNVDTIDEKRKLLDYVHKQIQQIYRRPPASFVQVVYDVFQVLGHTIPEPHEVGLKECERVLHVYNRFLEELFCAPFVEWINEVSTMEENLGKLNEVYAFLVKCKITLVNEDSSTLFDYLNEVGGSTITVAKVLDKLNVDTDIRTFMEDQTSRERELLDSMLIYVESGKTRIISSNQDRIIVKGRHVKFSEFVDDNGFPLGMNGNPPSEVLVMGSGSITFDKDVNSQGKTLQLIVIGNKWLISGRRTVELSGLDGVPLDDKKAKNGSSYGESGCNGLDGNPGGNGGTFSGFYGDISNAYNLSIKADAGNGSDGQDGGDGFKGKEVEHIGWAVSGAMLETVKTASTSFLSGGAAVDALALGPVSEGVVVCLAVAAPLRAGVNAARKIINERRSGKAVEKGGKGGNGGSAGAAGTAGVIKLFNVEDVKEIGTVSSNNGIGGNPGKGGLGGIDGKTTVNNMALENNGVDGASFTFNTSTPTEMFYSDEQDQFKKLILEEIHSTEEEKKLSLSNVR